MQYITLAYRDRIIEPAWWAPDNGSLWDQLGDLAEDMAERITTGKSSVTGTGGFRLCSSGTGIGVRTIFERVELGDGLIALRSLEVDPQTGLRPFVSADHDAVGPPGTEHLGVPGMQGGALWLLPLADPGQHETFREVELNDSDVALQTWRGLFVTAEGNGNGSPLTVNRDVIGAWQHFQYMVPPKELLPPPPPTLAEQLAKPVQEADTRLDVPLPPDPRTSVENARTELTLPGRLRDKIFRPFR